MTVLTAGTADYRPIVNAQARKCVELGYRHLTFDLGNLGTGIPFEVDPADLKPTVNGDSLPAALFKPLLVTCVLEQWAMANDIVCWLDADCIPLKEFVPPGDWDAAVTLRPVAEIGQSNNRALDFLNSGVVWIRNTPAGMEFAHDWHLRATECGTDQGGLNDAVAPHFTAENWRRAYGFRLHPVCGARVLVLDCAEWNSWSPPFIGARIAHFKRGIRQLAGGYLNV